MSELYKFCLEDNRGSLQKYLIDSLPSTNSLLGWLAGLGFFESDPPGKCQIWTSQPNPLEPHSEPVIWIFDSDHRLRMFVSTETTLDHGEFTPEAFQLAYSGVYPKGVDLPAYFKDAKLEELYQKSKETLKSVLLNFNKNHRTKSTGEDFILIHGCNCLWNPVFHENFEIIFDAPCFKFIKGLSTFENEPQLLLPAGLKMDSLQDSDVALVKESNKVDYPLDYVKDCCRINSAIRTSDTNELVAWSVTHRDVFVGSLHVMPSHRRKGLADIVLQDICKKHNAFFKNAIPNNDREIYATATVETFNTPSASLFRKKQWTEFGVGVGWIGFK